MSGRRLVDTATEADWSFMDLPWVVTAIEAAAKAAAREFDLVDFNDAYQDALLYVAVRPGIVPQAEREGRKPEQDRLNWLAQSVYTHGLRQSAVRESNRSNLRVQIREE